MDNRQEDFTTTVISQGSVSLEEFQSNLKQTYEQYKYSNLIIDLNPKSKETNSEFNLLMEIMSF